MKLLLIVCILLSSACSVQPRASKVFYKQNEIKVKHINNNDRKQLQKLLDKIAME